MARKKDTSNAGSADNASPRRNNATKKTRARYTNEEKVRATTIAVSMGGVSPAAIEAINKLLHININESTLSHWQTELKSTILEAQPDLSPDENLDISKLVADVRHELIVSHAETLTKISKLMKNDEVIGKASWNQLVLGSAILQDKFLLAIGRKPSTDNLVQELSAELLHIGRDIDDILADNLAVARRIHAEQIENNKPKQIQSTVDDTH